MKSLNKEQMAFLKKEFNIDSIDYSDKKSLQDIRLKCFDIETDETWERWEAGIDEPSIGERGDMAVSIIDDLMDIMRASKNENK